MTAPRLKIKPSGFQAALALSKPRLHWQTLRGPALHELLAAEARAAGTDPLSLKRAAEVRGHLELQTRPGRLVNDGCAWHVRVEL